MNRGLDINHNVCVCACFRVSTLKSLSMIALLAQPEGHMASLHLPGGVFYPTLPFCTFTTLHRRATGLISDWWAPPPPFPQWNMPFGTSAKVCWVAHARSPNQKTLMCDWERERHSLNSRFLDRNTIFWESDVLKKTRSAFHDNAWQVFIYLVNMLEHKPAASCPTVSIMRVTNIKYNI